LFTLAIEYNFCWRYRKSTVGVPNHHHLFYILRTVSFRLSTMKAPQFPAGITGVPFLSKDSKPISKILSKKAPSTSTLLKQITEATNKRRAFRKKTHCSDLRAEAILSNVIRMAKSNLARRQEEKRLKVRSFSYQLSITSQTFSCSGSSDADFLCKAQIPSEEVEGQFKSRIIESLDSFFQGLSQNDSCGVSV